jgi:hypothetical protein
MLPAAPGASGVVEGVGVIDGDTEGEKEGEGDGEGLAEGGTHALHAAPGDTTRTR